MTGADVTAVAPVPALMGAPAARGHGPAGIGPPPLQSAEERVRGAEWAHFIWEQRTMTFGMWGYAKILQSGEVGMPVCSQTFYECVEVCRRASGERRFASHVTHRSTGCRGGVWGCTDNHKEQFRSYPLSQLFGC